MNWRVFFQLLAAFSLMVTACVGLSLALIAAMTYVDHWWPLPAAVALIIVIGSALVGWRARDQRDEHEIGGI